MAMKKIISITLIVTCCCHIMAQQAGEAKILFEIRPEVNYVTHLYTLAGLGFSDEEYAAKLRRVANTAKNLGYSV